MISFQFFADCKMQNKQKSDYEFSTWKMRKVLNEFSFWNHSKNYSWNEAGTKMQVWFSLNEPGFVRKYKKWTYLGVLCTCNRWVHFGCINLLNIKFFTWKVFCLAKKKKNVFCFLSWPRKAPVWWISLIERWAGVYQNKKISWRLFFLPERKFCWKLFFSFQGRRRQKPFFFL